MSLTKIDATPRSVDDLIRAHNIVVVLHAQLPRDEAEALAKPTWAGIIEVLQWALGLESGFGRMIDQLDQDLKATGVDIEAAAIRNMKGGTQ